MPPSSLTGRKHSCLPHSCKSSGKQEGKKLCKWVCTNTNIQMTLCMRNTLLLLVAWQAHRGVFLHRVMVSCTPACLTLTLRKPALSFEIIFICWWSGGSPLSNIPVSISENISAIHKSHHASKSRADCWPLTALKTSPFSKFRCKEYPQLHHQLSASW